MFDQFFCGRRCLIASVPKNVLAKYLPFRSSEKKKEKENRLYTVGGKNPPSRDNFEVFVVASLKLVCLLFGGSFFNNYRPSSGHLVDLL